MSSKQVIRAGSFFTKHGKSKEVSFVREISIGLALGLAAGFTWKIYHWNENKKIEQYYHDLAKINALNKEES